MLNRILLDPGIKNDRWRSSTHHSYVPSDCLLGGIGLSHYSHGLLQVNTDSPLPTSSPLHTRSTPPTSSNPPTGSPLATGSTIPPGYALPTGSPRSASVPQLTNFAQPRLPLPLPSCSDIVTIDLTKKGPTAEDTVIDLTVDSPPSQNTSLQVENNITTMDVEDSRSTSEVADPVMNVRKDSGVYTSVPNKSRRPPEESAHSDSRLLQAPGKACNTEYVR